MTHQQTYDLVKNGGVHLTESINNNHNLHHHQQQHTSHYTDLSPNVPHDINSNKLDVNGSGGSNGGGDGDLRGDELDENFTLVDLQRSRISLDGGKTFRGHHPNHHQSGSNGKSFNDNILGTIGKLESFKKLGQIF